MSRRHPSCRTRCGALLNDRGNNLETFIALHALPAGGVFKHRVASSFFYRTSLDRKTSRETNIFPVLSCFAPSKLCAPECTIFHPRGQLGSSYDNPIVTIDAAARLGDSGVPWNKTTRARDGLLRIPGELTVRINLPAQVVQVVRYQLTQNPVTRANRDSGYQP